MIGGDVFRHRAYRLKPHLQAMNGKPALEQRYLQVKARIRRAAEASGRDPDGVGLLAVSKTFSAGSVAELAALGQVAFGENYLQEALGKMAALAHLRPGWPQPGLQWHFIGPIQSNKTRKIAESFDWVQSLADERIAGRLSEQRPHHLPPLDVCIQVNASGEASKSGCPPEQAQSLAEIVTRLPNLRLRGLMAIPEPTDDAALQGHRAAGMRELFERVHAALPPGAAAAFDTLSMGMSGDLEAAVAQGSTLVRVGSALFGERKA